MEEGVEPPETLTVRHAAPDAENLVQLDLFLRKRRSR